MILKKMKKQYMGLYDASSDDIELIRRMIRGTKFVWRTNPIVYIPSSIKNYKTIRRIFPEAEIDPGLTKALDSAKRLYGENKDSAKAIAEAKATPDGIFLTNHEFVLKPWTHQIRGFNILTTTHCAALLNDMRTGKTKIVVDSISWMKREGYRCKTLVIAPLNGIYTWIRETYTHSNNLTAVAIDGTAKKKIKIISNGTVLNRVVDGDIITTIGDDDTDLFIIGHDAIRSPKVFEALMKAKFDIVIIDELHRFKNFSAKRTKCAFELRQQAKRCYGLTGTMITNKPMDVYSQMRLLNPFSFKETYAEFCEKYCKFKSMGNYKLFLCAINVEELWERVDALSYKVKIEDCFDMPMQIDEKIFVDMSMDAEMNHAESLIDFVTTVDGVKQKSTKLTSIIRAQQIASGFINIKTAEGDRIYRYDENPKLDALKDLLEKHVENGNKIIVWATYQESIKMISELIDKLKYKYVTVSGKTSSLNRDKALLKFQRDDECMIFLANPACAGECFDLSVAKYMVYYEKGWDYAYDEQSGRRNYSHKSKELHGDRVVRYTLIARDSIEEIILEALSSKKNVSKYINEKMVKKFVDNTSKSAQAKLSRKRKQADDERKRLQTIQDNN